MMADAVDLADVQRALVIKLRHHGDVLLATPVFSVLKAAAPHIEIDALVYDETAEMLSGHPAIAQVHSVGRKWRKFAALTQRLNAEWTLLSALRARRYQLLVHLTDHPRGAMLARMLGTRLAIAPERRPRQRWWQGSFTHRYTPVANARRHVVEANLDALRCIGLHPEPDARKLSLVPGARADQRVDALLAEHRLQPGAFVLFHPTSRWSFKCWTTAGGAALVDTLQARGMPVVLTAAPSVTEREQIDAILAACKSSPTNLAGELSLKELAALIARARLFIGVDSAPMHMAAAVGTPVVVLFGPSGELEWGPWQVPHRVVRSDDHPCRPCGLAGCANTRVSDCLTTIPVSRVLAAVDALLG